MRRAHLAFLLLATTTLAAPPPAPGIDDFLRIRAPRQPVLGPDRTLYVVDWPDGVNQLYRRSAAATPGAPLERLTDLEDGVERFHLSPDGRHVVVETSRGGGEQTDLHHLDLAGGGLRPLYVDPAVVTRFQVWLPDGSGFIYVANDARREDFHVHHHHFGNDSSRPLLTEPGWWSVSDVSADGMLLLLGRYRSASQADAFVMNVESLAPRSINVEDGAYNAPGRFLFGDTAAVLVSDAGGDGIRRLWRHDLATGRAERPRPELDAYPVETLSSNPGDDVLAVTINDDGFRRLRLFAQPALDPVPVPPIEDGLVGDVELTGRFLSYTLSNLREPGRTFMFRVGRDAPAAPITEARTGDIDLGAFAPPRPVRIPSFDGLEVPAFLHLPPGHDGSSPVPFLVRFHGGPESQARPGFSPEVLFLLSRGYGVLEPNVRGSTGYGRRYHRLDDGAQRWDAVRDGAAAARWLVGEGLASPGRIATWGRSYGGFMAVATAIEAPDVIGAVVDIVGIVNFRTFLEQTGAYRRDLREAEYGSLEDAAMLESLSPLARVESLRAPVLIGHGLNDPRVPVAEAMRLATALQRLGHDPELVFFPDEGHRISKRENRALLYERIGRFLDRTIGG